MKDMPGKELDAISARYALEDDHELGRRILEDSKKYTIFQWQVQDQANPPAIKTADGIYLWDYDGKRYTDLCAEQVNVNLGLRNETIIKAIENQAEQLPYVAPRLTYAARAELGRILIEEIAPDNMSKVLFTTNGGDANEYAMRVAMQYTNRFKVFSKYDSYHGSHYGCGSLTGDSVRAAPFAGVSGVVHFPAPHLYSYDLRFDSEEEASRHFLAILESQIRFEGPEKIAALFIESVGGTNGIYIYPDGYLRGVRELCTKYGILMVCDEVMVGFGRCGAWWACCRAGVKPDIITFGKACSNGFGPCAGVLLSREIADYFDTHVLPAGITNSAHPLAVAATLATVKEYIKMDIVGHVLELEPYFAQRMEELKAHHPSIGDVRHIGLLGAVELVLDRETRAPMLQAKDGKPMPEAFTDYLFENGYYTFGHENKIILCPSLGIDRQTVGEIFDGLERMFDYADAQL